MRIPEGEDKEKGIESILKAIINKNCQYLGMKIRQSDS